MENFRVDNGQLHTRVGKTWKLRSNFTFDVLYEVQHPQDTLYVVKVLKDDGKSGEAYFKAGDLHNAKEFQGALNRTFKEGGLLCYFKNVELIALVAHKARLSSVAGNNRKKMAVTAGHQMDSVFVLLSPFQVIDLDSGIMINPDLCPFIWLTDPTLRGPKEDLSRHIQLPTEITPLTTFFDMASAILGNNLGPALLAWSYQYGLHFYRKWIRELRHFNLPILFGPPTVGKTLIAQCGAWLSGCSESHIASRCTLAFVTSWLTSSSLPFVWDDPTSAEEVAQLAIDLGNGAVRGKANDDPRSPLSGCMVTANFDLTTLFKYFSRLLVMVIQPLQRKKSTGDAKKLEDSARLASAALPIVLSAINTITLEDIATEVQKLELDADIRVLEGIALGITLTKKVLSVADCAKYMPDVLLYVEDQLIPYYQTSLARCLQVQKPDQPLYCGSPLEDGFEEQIISLVRENVGNGCTITKNGLAVKKDLVTPLHSAKTIRQHVQRLNGKQNHTVRLDGKPVKAILLPAASFSNIQWTTICQLLEMDEEETCVMQVHCSTVDTMPATSAATTDTALMPASTTAATVPASTTAATLPATTKAATKPATKPATTSVTTLTATRSATQPATNTTTAIERPVSTTTTATTTAATLPTITTATTKSATTDAALMPPATKPVTTTTTITSVTTLAATTSATQAVTTTTAISEPVSTTATATTSTATTTAATLPAITTATTKPATTDAALMPPATKPVTTTAAITSVTTLAATTTATQPVTTATAIAEPVSTTATATTSTATTTAATLPPITTATRTPATTDVALLPPATKPVTTNTTAITSVTTLTATSSATTSATQPAIAEPVSTTSTATTRAINLPVPNQRMRKSGDICQGCRKEGKPNLLWIQCTSCMLWYHRICSSLTVIQFKQKVRKDNIVWNCTKCQQ